MRVTWISFVILFAGCANIHQESAHHAKVTHVVIAWLKNPGDESARQKLIDVSRTFRSIPGVISVSAGRAIPSIRPVVDSSFDVAVVIRFKDVPSLRAYDSNAIHREAVESTLKPLVGKQIVYDVIDE